MALAMQNVKHENFLLRNEDKTSLIVMFIIRQMLFGLKPWTILQINLIFFSNMIDVRRQNSTKNIWSPKPCFKFQGIDNCLDAKC